MREVSQADERRKDSGQNLAYAVLWHICGLYVYTYNDSVLFKGAGKQNRCRRYGAVEHMGHDTADARLFYRKYSIVYTIWAFVSAGFKNWMRWFTIPVGAFISASIEYTQLITGRGYCQLDDFVTNTAGAAIGFLFI